MRGGWKRDDTLADRLLRNVRKGRGCWGWLGAKTGDGYGAFRYRRVVYVAHRAAWLVWRGQIGKGLFVCHHCDNPGCVNPKHLFLGTNSDNMLDAVAKGRQYRAALKYCPRGHEYAGSNLIATTQGGGYYKLRLCRECKRLKDRRYRARLAEAV